MPPSSICGLPGCGVKVDKGGLCTGCRSVNYCCKDHQRKDWPTHKLKCRSGKRCELLRNVFKDSQKNHSGSSSPTADGKKSQGTKNSAPSSDTLVQVSFNREQLVEMLKRVILLSTEFQLFIRRTCCPLLKMRKMKMRC